MKAVLTVRCPSEFEPGLSHLMHAGEPELLRNCYVCWFFCGETETEISCSYPSLHLKKMSWDESMWDVGWEDEAVEIRSSAKVIE